MNKYLLAGTIVLSLAVVAFGAYGLHSIGKNMDMLTFILLSA